MKLIFITFVTLLAITNAYDIWPGQYYWFRSGSCGNSAAMNLTMTGQNQFQTYRDDNYKLALYNIKMNSDAQTFAGYGALYDPSSGVFKGFTTVKGQYLSQFNFVVVYSPSSNPYYPGSTEYYNLISCSNTTQCVENKNEKVHHLDNDIVSLY